MGFVTEKSSMWRAGLSSQIFVSGSCSSVSAPPAIMCVEGFAALTVVLNQRSSIVTPWSGLLLTPEPMEGRNAIGFWVGKYPEIVSGFILR